MSSYDELVDLERNGPQPGEPGVGVTKLYRQLLYTGTTPEEALAAALVDRAAFWPHNIEPTKNWSVFAAVRWPWGDARGLLRAGGRTYWEANLRLRDKLVESARKLAKEDSEST